jgi:hypothetical protein
MSGHVLILVPAGTLLTLETSFALRVGFMSALKMTADGLLFLVSADRYVVFSIYFLPFSSVLIITLLRALIREVDAAQLHNISIRPPELTTMCLIPCFSLAGRRDQNPVIT